MQPPIKYVEKRTWLTIYLFFSIIEAILFFIPNNLLPPDISTILIAIFWMIYIVTTALVVYFTIWEDKVINAIQLIIPFFIIQLIFSVFSQVYPTGITGSYVIWFSVIMIIIEIILMIGNAFNWYEVEQPVLLVTKNQKLYHELMG